MSLSSAMNVGVSGLGINAEAISVVGNNIANVNTVGFKEGRTIFSDMLSATIATGQVGRGGQIQVIQNNFTQGSFENTSGANDLALQGDSFFVLQDSAGAQSFSRAGAFDYNDMQILTNPNGLQTMGFGINQTTGLSNGILGTIDKSKFTTMAASATTSAAMLLNLDSTQTIPGVTQTSIIGLSGNFGATTAPTTQTATQIFDEFGIAHTLAITWGGTSPNYSYSATISGVQAGTPGSTGSPITGTLSFPSTTNPPTQTLTFSNGAKSQPLTLNFTNIQNSGAAVAPSAAQNGSAGQQTGMVAVTGGMNAAGITAASSLTGTFALTPGTAATVTGATTSKGSATLTAAGAATLKNSTSLSNTATLTIGSNQIITANTTGLKVGMAVTDTTTPGNLTVPSTITAIDTLNNIVTLSAPALGSAVSNTITYKSNVITAGAPDTITGVDITGLVVGMAVADTTSPSNTETAVVAWSGIGPAGGSETVGDVVVTGVAVAGGYTPAQVAQAAGGATITGLTATWNGTPTNGGGAWFVASPDPSTPTQTVFTSTTSNSPLPDINIPAIPSFTGAAAAPIVSGIVQGLTGNIISGPPTYITNINTATNTVTLNTSGSVTPTVGDNLSFASNVVTIGSTTVSAVDTTGLFIGMDVSGTGIAANTTIGSIDTVNKTILLSTAATRNNFGTSLTFKTNVLTSGSNSIKGVDTTGLMVGMAVTDSTAATALGTITAIDPVTHTITLSANAGATSVGHTLAYANDIITNGSSTITGVDTSNISVGMVITGSAATGQPAITIPAGTVVSAISGSSITLSNPVTVAGATSEAANLSFGNDTTVLGDTTIYGVDVSNVKVGMLVSGTGIPIGSVVTALDINAKTVTISKPALASAAGVSLSFGSNNTTVNSNVVTAVDTSTISTGMTVSGPGIPSNTTVTAIDTTNKTVTLSNPASATASGIILTFGGAGFEFIDSSGTTRSGTLVVNNGVWSATVAGAANPVTGTVAAGTTGSTWTQNSSTVNIGGVNQTVKFDFGNANSSTSAVTVAANGFNSTDPSNTSNFSNSIVAYDSQGIPHNVNIYYRKIAANSWDYHAVIPDATALNGMIGNNVINGSLTFDASGILTAQSPPATSVNTVTFAGNVAPMSLSLDLGAGKSTQIASQSQATKTVDGYAQGSLQSTSIDEKGFITGSYSNNKTQRIAQIATARFASVAGLEKAGNSLFKSTAKAGEIEIKTADLQGSTVFTKSLEQSNVDMATQLVNMIKLQRAYSGNSKTITSSDEMMQETLALKR